MRLDQKHWFEENLSFECPNNATSTQNYLHSRCFHGGLERQLSPEEAIRLNFQSSSVEITVRVSVACDSNGKPPEITGTGVLPLQEPIYDTEKVQWSSSNQSNPSLNLKTVEVQPSPEFWGLTVPFLHYSPRVTKA